MWKYCKIYYVETLIGISHNNVNLHNLHPALFENIDMQRFEFWELQDPRKSGNRWTFDIYIKFCVYFMHVCKGKPSYYR